MYIIDTYTRCRMDMEYFRSDKQKTRHSYCHTNNRDDDNIKYVAYYNRENMRNSHNDNDNELARIRVLQAKLFVSYSISHTCPHFTTFWKFHFSMEMFPENIQNSAKHRAQLISLLSCAGLSFRWALRAPWCGAILSALFLSCLGPEATARHCSGVLIW